MNQPGWGCKIIKSFAATKLPVKIITELFRLFHYLMCWNEKAFTAK